MRIPSPQRVFRHLFLDQSSERYYSAESFHQAYEKENYANAILSKPEEDARYGVLMALLQRYDQGGPLLDAGCGDGLLWERYRPLSQSRLLGIDYAPSAIDKANARNIPNTHFEVNDYRGYKVAEPCSVVVFNEALYYVDAYMDAMAAMEKMLKPGGLIVVSMWENLINRRMWRNIATQYRPLQAVQIFDEVSKKRWRIAAFPRRQGI